MQQEKLTPQLIKEINAKQLQELDEKISAEMHAGSPLERKTKIQIRLLKKLNERELANAMKNKRKNSRFD